MRQSTPTHPAASGFRRLLAVGVLWFLAASSIGSVQPAEETKREASPRPNLVLILADDLGWTDLACAGSGYYETPRIDRLAEEGLRFTSFAVSQNCAPTRAAIWSGMYPCRTGIHTVGTLERGTEGTRAMRVPANATRLPLEIVTLAEALRRDGYRTGMFGKWHLGDDPEHHPSRRGFEEAVVSAGRHFGFATNPPQDGTEDLYLADYLSTEAVGFIERHRDEPFLLYVAHFAVHSPLEAKEALRAKYAAKPPAGGHRNPTYAAMIESLDASVGRIIDAIDGLGLASKTLILFASDNGGVGGYTVPPSKVRGGTTDNAPLRGGKGMLTEGGLRVPLIARWPGTIPAKTTSDEALAHVDLYPTFLEAAGTSPPAGQKLDGRSFLALARSGGRDRSPERALYWHFPGYLESYVPGTLWRTTPVGAIRRGPWKLFEYFEDGRLELYDLANDLGETRNLAGIQAETARRLATELRTWREEVSAPMPTAKGPAVLLAERIEDEVVVRVGDQELTRYRFARSGKYPYFASLRGPRSGLPVTTQGAEPWPHHSSLFFGCDRVGGANYWQDTLERGQILSRGPTIAVETGPTIVIEDKTDWAPLGSPPLLEDARRFEISAPSPDLRTIEVEIRWTALLDTKIERSNHALFAARVAPDLCPTGGGVLRNAEGLVGEKATFGRPSAWCDISGKRGEVVEGLALLDHPENPWSPCPWFTRDYGFISPTPMNWLPDEGLSFAKGRTFVLRYLVVIHGGDPVEADIAGIYARWIRTRRV